MDRALFDSFSFTVNDNFPSLFYIEVDLYLGSCVINDTLLEQFFSSFCVAIELTGRNFFYSG